MGIASMKFASVKFTRTMGVAALVFGLGAQTPALHGQTMGSGAAAAMTTTQMDPAKAMDKCSARWRVSSWAWRRRCRRTSTALLRARTTSSPARTRTSRCAHLWPAGGARNAGELPLFGSFAPTKPAVDVNAIANLTSKDDLVKALKDSFAYGHAAIASITPQNAFQIVNPKNPSTPATQSRRRHGPRV